MNEMKCIVCGGGMIGVQEPPCCTNTSCALCGWPLPRRAWNALCEVVERLRITVSGNWCCMGMASSGAHDEHCKHVAARAKLDALREVDRG